MNIRIRHPHRHTGLYLLAIMSPVFLVFLSRAWYFLVLQTTYAMGYYALTTVLVYISYWLFSILWAIFLARSCQHTAQVFALAALFNFLYYFVAFAYQFLDQVYTHKSWYFEVFNWIGYSVVYGLVFGGASVLVAVIYRALFSKIVFQNGDFCGQCGYQVTHCPTERCSECGTVIAGSTGPLNFVHRLSDKLARNIALAIILWMMVGGLLIGLRVYAQMPYWEFRDKYGYQGQVWRIGFVHRGEIQSYRLLDEYNDRALLIQYYRLYLWSEPHIELRLNVITQPGTSSSTVTFQEGNPIIVSVLNRAQTENVMEYSIPESLIDAILSRAEELGWLPVPAPVSTTAGKEVIVPADEHFPTLLRGPI